MAEIDLKAVQATIDGTEFGQESPLSGNGPAPSGSKPAGLRTDTFFVKGGVAALFQSICTYPGVFGGSISRVTDVSILGVEVAPDHPETLAAIGNMAGYVEHGPTIGVVFQLALFGVDVDDGPCLASALEKLPHSKKAWVYRLAERSAIELEQEGMDDDNYAPTLSCLHSFIHGFADGLQTERTGTLFGFDEGRTAGRACASHEPGS